MYAMYFIDSLSCEYASGSQYTKNLNVLGILICYIFTSYLQGS